MAMDMKGRYALAPKCRRRSVWRRGVLGAEVCRRSVVAEVSAPKCMHPKLGDFLFFQILLRIIQVVLSVIKIRLNVVVILNVSKHDQ